MKLTHNRAVLLMVLVTMMWSTAGVVSRHLDGARSFEVTFWRALFTVVAMLFILPLIRGRSVFADIRHAGRAFWISGICWSVMFTAYMVALTLTSVANVLITMSLGPLMTALIARVFIGHRIVMRTWVAIAVAGFGIAYMYAPQIAGGQLLGTLVALCVPIAGATNWTVTQNAHAQGHDVDLVPAVFVGAVISALVALPLAYPFQATAHDLGLLAFLGAFQLAIPCVLSVMCARLLKAPELSLLALLEVPFGILLVWLGAGEAPGTTVLVGGTLVISALVANELLGWKQRSQTP
jgi:drug/metabolite transporter (DMT)-like permease